MSLPIYQRVAVTDAGDVIPGAEYTVINENTGVAAPIYSDRTGATLLSAPYFADSAGTIQFFIAQGTTFRVAASGGVGTYTDRYVYGVAEAVLVQADGNVGIGVVPETWRANDFIGLQVGTGAAVYGRGSGDEDKSGLASNAYYDNDNDRWQYIATKAATNYYQVSGQHLFQVAASGTADTAISWSEAMRIDSAGNLLVAKTSTSSSTAGIRFAGSDPGYSEHTRSGGTVMYLNRLSSDGTIMQFAQGNSVVGSVGIQSYGFEISGEAGHAGISFATVAWVPMNDGARVDDTISLGVSSYRFDDIYLTNAPTITSDRNEKQDILEITTAEYNVAKACKGLLRSFRWIDAVEKKGDDARIHFGIIAQDLQGAFTAEGLDAGRYGMFMSNTWWETETEVAAVEAADEVTDEDGNVTTEAVEAKDAYTRTDTFDTLAEAPAGATERTRLGVRYSELLAFIIAAI